MPPRRLSGLQKQVLSLYRECLRRARELPSESRVDAVNFARSEFKAAARISTLDIQRIEHLIRQGNKKLALLKSSDVTGFRSSYSAASMASPHTQTR
jgi:succinate dehydrogenase assembly factor 1